MQWSAISALRDGNRPADADALNAVRDPVEVLRQSLALLDGDLPGDARAAVTCLVSMVRPHAEAAS